MPHISEVLGIKRPKRIIQELRWDETSGVDSPANLVPGWAIMKSRGASSDMSTINPDVQILERLLKAESKNIKADQTLLNAVSKADLTDAPSNVQQASNILRKYLDETYGSTLKARKKVLKEDPGDNTEDQDDQSEEGTVQNARQTVSDDDDDDDGDDDEDDPKARSVEKMSPKRLIKAMIDLLGLTKSQKETHDGYTDTSWQPAPSGGSNKPYDEQAAPGSGDAIFNKVLSEALADFQKRLAEVMRLKRSGADLDIVKKAANDSVDWLEGELAKGYKKYSTRS